MDLIKKRLLKSCLGWKRLWSEKVTYLRLRDWLFSRQRYWVNQSQSFIGKMELQQLFQKVNSHLSWPVPRTFALQVLVKAHWLTLDRLAGSHPWRWCQRSSWDGHDATMGWKLLVLPPLYRSNNNTEKFADEDLLKTMVAVDIYVGGAEHAALHLLYARFWHKFPMIFMLYRLKRAIQKTL